MSKLTKSVDTHTVGPFANMVPGETRSFTFKNGITKTITRTRRPFLFDWCDAGNIELAQKNSQYRWVVEAFEDGTCTAKLVAKRFLPNPNAKPWRPTPEEIEEVKANVARSLTTIASSAK